MTTLQSGSRVGVYEVLAKVGAGGMGEVYRARDTKLKRDVAIKVLPAEFAGDPERLARARREGEVLASLNHAHIAQIYGQEEAEGSHCLVLEFVNGETIQERALRGPIPWQEALEIARQIADALEAAHTRGIVHRDLKPANIKVTPEGQVKVLDFGLAKALEPTPADNVSQSPTVLGGPTGAGVILGTSSYMSPEQAKGRAADTRSDIWSFGVVLYEMLTGKPAFDGETLMEVLGAVLRADPDWTVLPESTPPAVRSLLRRCLQKDRSRRLRDIADARFQIEETLNEPQSARPDEPVRKNRPGLQWLAATLLMMAATAAAVFYFRPAPTPLPETRVQIVTPSASSMTSFAISPDGRKLVFEATVAGKSQLWLRSLEAEAPQPLQGTDNPIHPFWSPDNLSVGFMAEGRLKRVDINGGTAQTLANAPTGNGGTWDAEGYVLYSPGGTSPLYRVPAAGGKQEEATRLERGQVGHRFPHFLPDGRHFLFFVLGAPEVRGVYVGSTGSKESRRLFDADTTAVFAPPDHALFARQGTLFAQQLDLSALISKGDPFPVAGQVMVRSINAGDAALSASPAGSIAYRSGSKRQLIWWERSGKQTVLGEPDTADLDSIRLSPDGRYVAFSRVVDGNSDIWLIDTARGLLRRITTEKEYDGVPIWSPDSSRIVFASRRKGHRELYEKPLNGPGVETSLLDPRYPPDANDWSVDGRFLLYHLYTDKTGNDLWALPLAGDRKPFAIAETASDEFNGRYSFDSRWIAFESTETGRSEIFVQPFPGPGAKTQISAGGGTSPRWRGDGRELFYMGPDNRLMAAPIRMQGSSVEVETPVALFTTRPGSQFEAAPDGQRFLINMLMEDAAPITLILNWSGRKR